MKIETENGQFIHQPDAKQIYACLRGLNEDNSFGIFSTSEQHYIQTSGHLASGFIIAYRDGDEARDLVAETFV